jgi:hypothetical protein
VKKDRSISAIVFLACIVDISPAVSALKYQTIPINRKYFWLRRTSVGAQRGFRQHKKSARSKVL